MKPNKALQGTQPIICDSNTNQHIKSPQAGLNGLCMGDNPQSQSIDVGLLEYWFTKRADMSYKYRVSPNAIDMLVRIGKNWNNGIASTLYTLSVNRDKANISALWLKATKLQAKGLIEVVGTGVTGRANAYAPSIKGKQLLLELCSIGSN